MNTCDKKALKIHRNRFHSQSLIGKSRANILFLFAFLTLSSCYETAYNPPYIISHTPSEEECREEKNMNTK
jgi:hypothetical protein